MYHMRGTGKNTLLLKANEKTKTSAVLKHVTYRVNKSEYYYACFTKYGMLIT